MSEEDPITEMGRVPFLHRHHVIWPAISRIFLSKNSFAYTVFHSSSDVSSQIASDLYT